VNEEEREEEEDDVGNLRQSCFPYLQTVLDDPGPDPDAFFQCCGSRSVFFGLPDLDQLVRGTDPEPDLSIIKQKNKKNLDSYCFVTSL
jgi:hypothetical protein